MKFRDIYNIIREIDIKKLDIQTSTQQRNGSNYQVMYIKKEQKDILQKILEIPYFKDEFGDFLNKNFLSTQIEEFNKNIETIEKIRIIKEIVKFYKTCFEKMYPELSEFSISIKIPDEYTLGEIGEYFNDLQKTVYPLLIDKRIDGDFILKNFDTGSKWIDIVVKNAPALLLIIGLMKEASEVAVNIQDFRLKQLEIEEKIQILEKEKTEKNSEKLEEINKRIEKYKNFNEIHSEMSEEYQEKKVEEIYQKYYASISSDDNDKELKSKISQALKNIGNHILEGSYIRPAIEYKENFEGVDIQRFLAYEETRTIEDKSIKG